MRTDETGHECPATLGEYRDICAKVNPNSKAVALLDKKIAKWGRDEEVIVSDAQMRTTLMPLLIEDA